MILEPLLNGVLIIVKIFFNCIS